MAEKRETAWSARLGWGTIPVSQSLAFGEGSISAEKAGFIPTTKAKAVAVGAWKPEVVGYKKPSYIETSLEGWNRASPSTQRWMATYWAGKKGVPVELVSGITRMTKSQIERTSLPTGMDKGTWERLGWKSKRAILEGTVEKVAPKPSFAQEAWRGATPWKEEAGETVSPKGVGLMAAEVAVPGVYAARHWGEIGKGQPGWAGISQKAGIIGLDVLTLVPVVGLVGKGVRLGVSIPRAAGRALVAEVKAPYTMFRHPVATARGIYEVAETVIHPSKIPTTALERTWATTRVPISEVGRPAETMALRDVATLQAIRGERPAAKVGRSTLELYIPSLQRVGGPAAVHATPSLEKFLSGAVVQPGREGGLFVSPSLHTRFAGVSAFGKGGALPGGLIIREPKVLRSLIPSGKIYKGAAEIEAVIPAGVSIPPVSQRLFTRGMGGEKLTLGVVGKPYGPLEIAGLKVLGASDILRQIMRPAYKVGKVGRVGEVATKRGLFPGLEVGGFDVLPAASRAYQDVSPMRTVGGVSRAYRAAGLGTGSEFGGRLRQYVEGGYVGKQPARLRGLTPDAEGRLGRALPGRVLPDIERLRGRVGLEEERVAVRPPGAEAPVPPRVTPSVLYRTDVGRVPRRVVSPLFGDVVPTRIPGKPTIELGVLEILKKKKKKPLRGKVKKVEAFMGTLPSLYLHMPKPLAPVVKPLQPRPIIGQKITKLIGERRLPVGLRVV